MGMYKIQNNNGTVNIILKKTLPVQIWKFFNPEILTDFGGGSVRKT